MTHPEEFPFKPSNPEDAHHRTRRGLIIGAVAITSTALAAAGALYLITPDNQDPTINCTDNDGMSLFRINTARSQVSGIDVVGYDGDTTRLPVVVTAADQAFSINGHTYSYGEIE